MSKTRAGWLFLLLFVCSLSKPVSAGSHSNNSNDILRRYPMASAVEVPVTTQIGISATVSFVLSDAAFVVIGSNSGIHTGSIHLSVDGTTIIFRPDIAFDLNENVHVALTAYVMDGSKVTDTFSFRTVRRTLDYQVVQKSMLESSMQSGSATGKFPSDHTLDNVWPGLTVNSNASPTDGDIFLSFQGPFSLCGLVIVDQDGMLEAFDAVQGSNFELQPNGEMTYFGGLGEYYAMDSSFNIVDSFLCTNGYVDDGHEFLLQKDGSYTILGITLSTVDLSSVGGSDTAHVQGNVIQTFDSGGNLIFEWRGIDHYTVSDAEGIPFTSWPVDFEHANAIDRDSEGNYLLSNRHLCEVTKIDAATGAMIWRLGGRKNQFSCANDTLGFSYQHCARFLPNDHILLFDNGDLHAVQESRAAEFALDTTHKTDTLVWQFHHSPEVYSLACGSVERLPNGNTYIGWGIQAGSSGPGPTQGTTEVQPDGTVVSDWTFATNLMSYRAQFVPAAPPAAVTQNPPPTTTFTATTSGNGTLDLSFSTAEQAHVSIGLYDLMGSNVETLYDGMASSNIQTLEKSFSPSSGVYYAVLSTPSGKMVRPISFIR